MIPNTNLFSIKRSIRIFSSILLCVAAFMLKANAQPIDNNGCIGGNFGIFKGLYVNVMDFDFIPAFFIPAI